MLSGVILTMGMNEIPQVDMLSFHSPFFETAAMTKNTADRLIFWVTLPSKHWGVVQELHHIPSHVPHVW